MDMRAAIQITANVKGQQEIDRLRGSMGALEGTVGMVKKAMGVLGVAFTAQQFGSWIKGSIDFADSLNDLRQKTGFAVEDLNALALVAEQNGTTLDAVAGGLAKLGRTIGDALGGNAGAVANLKQFGIGLQELKSGSLPATEALARIADSVSQMPDGLQKAAAVQKIFGRGAADLVPVLNAGGDAIRRARSELQEYGALISGEFASAADGFNDKLAVLKFIATGYGTILADALIPALLSLSSGLSGANDEAKNFANNNALKDWSQQAAINLSGLIDVIRFLVQDLKVLFGTTEIAVQSVISAFTIAKNGPSALFGDEAASNAVSDAVSSWNAQREQFFTDIAGLWNFDFNKAQEAVKQAIDRQNEQRSAPGKTDLGGASNINRGFDFGADDAAQKAAAALKKRNEDLKRQNELISDYVLRENEAIDLLRLEGEAVNMSSFEYEQLVAAKEHEYDVSRATNDMLPEMAAKYREVADSLFATKQELERFNHEQSQTFSAGASSAFREYIDGISDVSDEANQLFTDAFAGMEDALVSFVKTGKLDFSDLVDSILEDLARLAIRQAIMGPLVGALNGALGFANGGIMSANGPVPLRTYASGGIANSPQLAVFGEGSMNEAFVPLPDGRSIPVKMHGGGSNVSVVVNNHSGQNVATNETTDGRGNRRIEVSIGDMVAGEIRRPGSSANMAIRNSFRAAPALTGR
jgi:lambda family phage tail tape measure protein